MRIVLAHKRRWLILGITLFSLVTGLVLLKGCTDLPSDRELTARFKMHRSCFERIRVLALDDSQKGVNRITPDRVQFVTDRTPKEWERRRVLSDARWNEYRLLFICAGLDHINGGIAFGPSRVTFLAVNRGLAGSGYDKGYLWTREAPEPIVPSLDNLRALAEGQWFEKIDTDWYLEFTQE